MRVAMHRLCLMMMMTAGCQFFSLAPPPSDAKAISTFSFGAVGPSGTSGTISGTRIKVLVPLGTDVTALVATFTTTGAKVTVGDAEQVSGMTANDYTHPVIYTVTADD